MFGLSTNTMFSFIKKRKFLKAIVLMILTVPIWILLQNVPKYICDDCSPSIIVFGRGNKTSRAYFTWNNSPQPVTDVPSYVNNTFNADHAYGFGWKEENDSVTFERDPIDDGYVLKVFYKKGTRSFYGSDGAPCTSKRTKPCMRGAGFYVQPPDLYKQGRTFAALEYELYFEKGFEFASGGKLPGLWGGANTCTGCNEERTECFTMRLMWRAQGQGEVYGYFPYQQKGNWTEWCRSYNVNNNVYCPNDTCGVEIGKTTTGGFRFVPGQWHRIRLEVEVGIPKEYGRITLWVDNDLKVNINKVVLRVTDKFGVDGMIFSTFYGGSLPFYGEHGDHSVYFRNFRISDEHFHVPPGEYFQV